MSDGSERQSSLPWISSAAGSPARTSALPGGAPASTANAPASGASFAASSRNSRRGSSSSRTSPAASGDGCPRCGATCTCSATVRLPSRFQPSTSARPSDARACSWLLPTPTATPYGSTNNGSPHDGREAYATAGKLSLEGMAVAGLLPTPRASDGEGGGWNARSTDLSRGRPLSEVIDGAIRGLLPTPLARDVGRGGWHEEDQDVRRGRPLSEVMARATRGLLPTPTVKGNYAEPRETGRSGYGLATKAASSGPLSPRFVEWLMGFPDGWTDCEPLAMPLFPSAPKRSGG